MLTKLLCDLSGFWFLDFKKDHDDLCYNESGSQNANESDVEDQSSHEVDSSRSDEEDPYLSDSKDGNSSENDEDIFFLASETPQRNISGSLFCQSL